jgi:hypothetical protein
VHEDVDRALREQGERLADAVEAAIPRWIERCVGGAADATEAIERTREAVMPRLRSLLAADVDDQRENPLSILRAAVSHPTDALRRAGVEARPRQAFDAEHFPGDDYGLTPMTWRDVDESLHEPGLVWGALKARAAMTRHRPT